MKTCNVCGKELDMSAEFCDACGSSDLKSPEAAKVDAPAPKKGGKVLAIVGLILPIVGIVIYGLAAIFRTLLGFLVNPMIIGFFSIPVTIIALILAVVGLILSIAALIKKSKMGIAGIIISVLSLLGLAAFELLTVIASAATTIFNIIMIAFSNGF